MKTLLASALALGALTSMALAEPLTLTDVQMDAVTGGQVDVSQTVTQSSDTNVAVGGAVTVTQEATQTSSGNVSVVTTPPAGDDG